MLQQWRTKDLFVQFSKTKAKERKEAEVKLENELKQTLVKLIPISLEAT